jgi:hypothetical protein
MSRLDREPAVLRMASELGVPTDDPVSAILRFCRQRIDRVCRECGRTVTNLAELQGAVCKHLCLVFEDIRTDKDLERVVAKYVSMREFGFAALRGDLDPQTFGALLERRNVDASAPDRYVAVIDCRGPEKCARQYFTRWHEIAHLFTLTRQLELPYHRSTDRDPIERLMDVIAGELGFYDPLVKPAIREEIARARRLTFAGVERVRDAVCPDASFRATLNACVARATDPVVLLEAGMGYKKAELAALKSKQLMLLPAAPPKAQLRVLSAAANNAARSSGLRVDKNMRIPSASIVSRHFQTADGLVSATDQEDRESLSIWRHSDGTPVGHVDVWVHTRQVGDRVLALLQPVRSRSQR